MTNALITAFQCFPKLFIFLPQCCTAGFLPVEQWLGSHLTYTHTRSRPEKCCMWSGRVPYQCGRAAVLTIKHALVLWHEKQGSLREVWPTKTSTSKQEGTVIILPSKNIMDPIHKTFSTVFRKMNSKLLNLSKIVEISFTNSRLDLL